MNMKRVLVLIALIMLLFTACRGKDEQGVRLGMLVDMGGVDDRSFNQGVHEGLLKAGSETGAVVTYLKPADLSVAERISSLTDLYDRGYGFIVLPGYAFSDIVDIAAGYYPELSLSLVDITPQEAPSKNVSVNIFREEQGGFLVGVASSLEIKEGLLGFVGGVKLPPVIRYENGFIQGIEYANRNLGTNIIIDRSNFIYAGSFNDMALGSQLGNALYSKGVKAVFTAAGSTGLGVINEAKNRRLKGNKVWVIGVDSDQYSLGELGDGTSCILTSAIKNVSLVAYRNALDYIAGNFPGGEIKYHGVNNGGMGIPENNPNLSDETLRSLEEVIRKISEGELIVRE